MTDSFTQRNNARNDDRLDAEKHTRDGEEYYLPRNVLVPAGYSVRLAWNVDNLVEYVGLSLPGTATSEAGWQVRKCTYSTTYLQSILWADGDRNFDNIWDDRVSLSYS